MHDVAASHYRSEVPTVLDGERRAVVQQGLCRAADPVEPLHAGERVSEIADRGRRVPYRGEDR